MAPRHWVFGVLRFEMVTFSHFQGSKLLKIVPFFVALLHHHSVSNHTRVTRHFLRLVIVTEAILLCLLRNKPHSFILTQQVFILIQIVPLHVRYMFRPALRPSSDTSIQKPYKGRYKKNLKAPLHFYSHYLCNVKTLNIYIFHVLLNTK